MSEYRIDRHMVAEDWPLWLLILAELAAGLILLPHLAGPVPVHFGLNGQPNRWQPAREAVLIMPLLTTVLYLVLLLGPLIDPRRRNYAAFGPTLRIVRWAIVLLLVAVQGAALASAAGTPLAGRTIPRVVAAVLLLVPGNSMGRLRPNWFFGIRTPWTLSSDEVWRDTHRLAGRCMVIAGLVAVPLVFVATLWATEASVGLLLTAVIVPAVYSYFRYRAVTSPRQR